VIARGLYTIPTGAPFLDALARGLAEAAGPDPAALSRITVLLPTRRACRALGAAFARAASAGALILPRIQPLGGIDEDELALEGAPAAGEGAAALEIPPAIGELRRALLLSGMIRARLGEEAQGLAPVQALALARGLAGLIDQAETEGVSLDRLGALVPDELAKHWQRTVDFLGVVTTDWPAALEREQAIDPARRRTLLLEALAARWKLSPPTDPVIAAGSTGSVPATAALLGVIAALPQGAVVLPGLDQGLAEEAWEMLAPSHPQYGMKALIERLGFKREEIRVWPGAAVPPAAAARARLLSHALTPAEATAGWKSAAAEIAALAPEALAEVHRIECPDPQAEALTIALLLREALESEGRTAAVVTPDRALARRIASELRRYAIEIDDSGGVPLAHSAPGAFLALVARMVMGQAEAVPLLACLKHPLAAGGQPPAVFRSLVRRLDRKVLRGPRREGGFAGVLAGIPADDAATLAPWVRDLALRTAPLGDLVEAGPQPLERLVQAHIAVAESLAASDTVPGPARLWQGDAGEALAELMAELMQAAAGEAPIAAASYPALFEAALAGSVARPARPAHPRLAILGLLEARLVGFDLVVLAGLNEGTWPPGAADDPWMSRPMRETLGLPSLDRRIGLTAHDFVQACGAPAVVLTRATRAEGTPTVPSRWLSRLDGLLGAGGAAPPAARPELAAWRGALDAAPPLPPARAPAPTPPVANRPRQLSVTEIETWRRDPYAIYARRILRLFPLPPLDEMPDARIYGNAVHGVLDKYVLAHSAAWPADAAAELLSVGREVLRRELERPEIWAFWWPRFVRMVGWFDAHERRWRAEAAPEKLETKGQLVIEAPAGPFTLTARADRLDRVRADRSLAIIDYKSGVAPDIREVAEGTKVQLSLEAAIAIAGGFTERREKVTRLRYWRLHGRDEGGEEIAIDGAVYDRGRVAVPAVSALAREAERGLQRLIERFDRQETPYVAKPHPDFLPDFSDYDHLSRARAWSAEED